MLALNLTGGSLNLMSLIGVIMLMGLVAKNAILLLDCAREEERQGIDREEALMHAGRVRLRPILMTTFALMAGMMPVAIGVGEGGEFYSPMAVAIIGGTIVSTLLTLLVVPSFYDSIEIARERAALKFHARAAYGNPFVAFMITLVEALLTLVFIRFFYRVGRVLAARPQHAGANIRWNAPRGWSGSQCPPVSSRAPSAGSVAGAGADEHRRAIADPDAGATPNALEADQGELISGAGSDHSCRSISSVGDLQPLLRGHADLARTRALGVRSAARAALRTHRSSSGRWACRCATRSRSAAPASARANCRARRCRRST